MACYIFFVSLALYLATQTNVCGDHIMQRISFHHYAHFLYLMKNESNLAEKLLNEHASKDVMAIHTAFSIVLIIL